MFKRHIFPIDLFVSPYLFLGAAKEAPIVTPLMEYIRQKRAIESGVQVMCYIFSYLLLITLSVYFKEKCSFIVV